MGYEQILQSIFPSPDMRDYLIEKGLDHSVSDIEDLIMRAPVPLRLKQELMEQISSDVEKDDEDRIEKINNYSAILDLAFQYMDDEKTRDCVFVIENCEYYEEECSLDYSFQTVCGSFSDVVSWINEDIEINEYDENNKSCYYVGVWEKDNSRKYNNIIDYIFVLSDVYYVEVSDDYRRENGIGYYMRYEINVEVPFKAGDIIEVNGAPFCPEYKALVTNVGDNHDCCCIQVATCDANGLWQVGALKHNYVVLETYPFISPLFTATRYSGELSPDELILAELRDFIEGSEEKGRIIWDYLACDNRSETDLRNYIKSFISMTRTMAT